MIYKRISVLHSLQHNDLLGGSDTSLEEDVTVSVQAREEEDGFKGQLINHFLP